MAQIGGGTADSVNGIVPLQPATMLSFTVQFGGAVSCETGTCILLRFIVLIFPSMSPQDR
jgi:hypothetical protein